MTYSFINLNREAAVRLYTSLRAQSVSKCSFIDLNTYVDDVRQAIQQFDHEKEVLDRIGGKYPVLKAHNRRVPVSLVNFDDRKIEAPERSRIETSRTEELARLVNEHPSTIAASWPDLELESLPEATKLFDQNATDYLESRRNEVEGHIDTLGRLAAPTPDPNDEKPGLLAKGSGGAGKTGTPTYTFVVTTKTPGLRVFRSGDIMLFPVWFGSPTSPVSSVLFTGRYIFGVDGGPYGSAIQWDRSAVAKSPGSTNVHLNF